MCIRDRNSAAQNGIQFKAEGFADRVYTEDLALKSRTLDNAVINDAETAFLQFKNLYEHQQILCDDGVERKLEVQTICVHSDTSTALDILKKIHQYLNGLK